MQYLQSFSAASESAEVSYVLDNHNPRLNMACYGNNIYPFRVLLQKQLPAPLTFAPITVFYGGNGSGKSTLLNLIAEKLELDRDAPMNRTPFFPDYLALCRAELCPGIHRIPEQSRIITSDAVFDFLLNVRACNDGIDRSREELFAEYTRDRDPDRHMQLKSLDEFEEFRRFHEVKRSTKSAYTAKRLRENLPCKSNGESAYLYFTQKIEENALYLLDEPENSLSPELQQKLAQFLLDSVRFYGCQLILSTHSPFLLALRDAKIYNLDACPVREARWTDLPAVRLYYDFFEEHRKAFTEV